MIGSILLANSMKSWWMFIFFYAGILPISFGLFYSIPVILGWEWFPERKGLVSGLIIGANGFASFISSFLSQAIVNPNNQSPDKVTKYFSTDITHNLSKMFNTCVAFYTILCLCGICAISRNQKYVQN